jgi:aryl sulfotransferase
VSGIVWLASYPKSGNTWLRVLLTNYLRDASEPADINQLFGAPIAGARRRFDEWVGVEGSTGFARRCTAAWPGMRTRRCS